MSRNLGQIEIEPEAELLVGFVNTRDLEEETDSVADPASLGAWVSTHIKGAAGVAIDDAEHARVLALREAVRALLGTNNGGTATAAELRPLHDAAERAAYKASLGDNGELEIAPAGTGVASVEARLLLALERVQALGGWPRLKACQADDCQWAFFDSTRNRSRTWCSMDECGNKVKTRRYRSRKATGASR